MREFVVTLLIAVCFYLAMELKACDLNECLICDLYPASCPACLPTSPNCNISLPNNCTMKVLNITTDPELPVPEGKSVTVNCSVDLPNASFSWIKDGELQTNEKTSMLLINTLLESTTVECHVNSSICGDFNSTLTITVKAGDYLVIILVCVGAAAALLMLFAIGMKVALRRGQVKSRARKMERQQHMENIHSTTSTVNTVSSYY
ncbi:uncharacterized protein [Danio rerio]|uniref:Ig-like domain-containing protein n=1 Tax=Danio rerio TaxID=7955 RepID=A0A8M3AZK3_DANRE|nr:uncharacterized protein LOC103912050 [Danio rerio]|eukprot:XP_009305922.1 uncharacterized protein LOC103912050 [Danio rerio]